jgi:3-oxoacyl-[acyl-carrier-protein] synthase I
MISGKMNPISISNYTYTSCLGEGREANWQAINTHQSGLTTCDFFNIRDLTTWIGKVNNLNCALPNEWQDYDCRNNRLAWLALQQDDFFSATRDAIKKVGAARVGIFIGTSTSGIHETERAYFESTTHLPDWYHYHTTHDISSVASFVQHVFGTRGPCIAISTACSSSAKVFASAYRAIHAGLCDVAIVGGVDSLCLTTLYGFHSLQLLSPEKCKPFDRHRSGISIGEAGGFALLQKGNDADFFLYGYGESGDAHHMSSPHPEGEGAALAMQAALHKAGITANEIDYINLHGTGTQANDAAEAKAIANLFGYSVSVSSTKGWMGHTLGAAGIVEVCIGLQALNHGYLPENLHLQQTDDDVHIRLLKQPEKRTIKKVLSNSFGFGGSNCSLILGGC